MPHPFWKKNNNNLFLKYQCFQSRASICKLGAFSHASFFFFLKKKKGERPLSCFHKKSRFPKNHAFISKLGAFSHASSILKKKRKEKEIIFSLNINVFKSYALICKLGHLAMPHSFSKKKKKRRKRRREPPSSSFHEKSRFQDFKKIHAFISKLGPFGYASFRWDHLCEDLPSKFKVLTNKVT